MAAIIDRHFESGIVHVQSPQKSGSASLPRAMKSGNWLPRAVHAEFRAIWLQKSLGGHVEQNLGDPHSMFLKFKLCLHP